MSLLSKRIGWVLLVILMLQPAGLPAQDNADLGSSRDRLAEIQKQIDNTLTDLRNKRAKAGTLTEELEKLERETRRIARQVKRSGGELKQIESRQKEQRQRLAETEASMVKMKERVQTRLVALYKSGEKGLVKALLTTSATPLEIAERYAFLSRMVRQDRTLLDEYRTQIVEQQALVDELDRLRVKQAETVTRRRQEEEVLRSARSARKRVLASIREDETILQSELDELRAKAARLSDLVKKLETDLEQSYTESLSGLKALKGRLPWPVSGKVRVGFGTGRHAELGTMIDSNGLEISADIGTPVKTIAAGKILYASQFRGYGKLMIIDHGDKHYSLYAHVARFNKDVGDLVAPGEVVAHSGFEGRDYIYFELRHQGEPFDPRPWLMPRQ